jgi:hypothetical protein
LSAADAEWLGRFGIGAATMEPSPVDTLHRIAAYGFPLLLFTPILALIAALRSTGPARSALLFLFLASALYIATGPFIAGWPSLRYLHALPWMAALAAGGALAKRQEHLSSEQQGRQ